ncbi:hypothetical protein SteCoe_28312 [Stentor coeruleus]|uniref:Peptidase S49 domain-containing protein n=1 Tax=Stentor coeruleus TaxID=5963 RepID=A0A1R2B8T0_9CILI|nr:hypothetical protein SteCoe_28312 [Stentor coeruleus]
MFTRLFANLFKNVIHLRINVPLSPKVTSQVLKQVSKFHIYKPKAIALSVDSLGQSLVQGEIIAKAISNKAKELQCPYYTFAENLALGSGYLLLASGNKVHVGPHSLIGGVSSSYMGIGLVKALKQWKIKNTTIATNEIHINPLEEVRPVDEKWIKDMLTSQNEALKCAIKIYRKQALESELVNKGDVFIGNKACEQGLADGVNDFYSVISSEFPNARVVNIPFDDNKGGVFGAEIMDELMGGEISREVLDEITGFSSDDLALQLRAKVNF